VLIQYSRIFVLMDIYYALYFQPIGNRI